jgi:hypothetical protein
MLPEKVEGEFQVTGHFFFFAVVGIEPSASSLQINLFTSLSTFWPFLFLFIYLFT